jgi:hypothetical protein
MRLPLLIVILGAATQLGNTDCGQALRDSGFDLWCGDGLCAWKVERGEIQRVATWNKGDPGVELVGSDVAIEQLSPVDSGDGTCLEFTLVANVEPSADVELNVDVFGDGSIEHSERLPTAHWKPLTYDLLIQGPYRGIRFELAKTGDGTAQVANIGARTLQPGDCAGLTPIVPGPAPLGASCDPENAATCASGLCTVVADPDAWLGISAECEGCDDTHPCTGSEVCGLHEPTSPVRESSNSCVPPGSKELGERCTIADECASNVCNGGRCSACDAATCASCGDAWPAGPRVCSPGQHLGHAGDACGTDDDCASAICDGSERKECDDGRPCASAADCQFGTGSNDPLMNGACTTVGIQGGTCR